MFSRQVLSAVRALHTTATPNFQVAVLGAAGGIGQPLSLLLKLNPLVTKLTCYDVSKLAKGVAVDLSHIDTPSSVKGFAGAEELGASLKGADVVVIPAGVPRKPGMTRDDLFNTNANIVKSLTEAVAQHSPNAIIAIISNPVNSTVPIAAEALKKAGVYNPKKLMGVTTLDVVRANTFVGEAKGINPTQIRVPVIGGHAGGTILPLLSQTQPATTFTNEERDKLTVRIQNGGTEVVEAKDGAGSATLSMAHAANVFVTAVLKGLSGHPNVVAEAFVESSITPAKFFATPILLSKNGVEKNLGYGQLSEYEQGKLDKEALPELLGSITKGEKFGK